MSRADVLKQYGIVDRTEIRVNPVQEGSSPLWLVGINGIGDPIKAISPKQAQELAIKLREIGENDLASQISIAAHKAHRANGNA